MKNRRNVFIVAAAVMGMIAGAASAAPSKNFKVFLCFGQSNMSGGNGVQPSADDKKTNPRIKVLAFANCSSPSRTANTWSDACEPMHCGDGMNTLGPSYAFGRAIADSLPNDTIGLIPCGQWGVAIEFFMKGGNYTGTKPSTPGGNNVYQWMLTKCKEAQKRGVLAGIVLHQGESNSGQSDWPTKVKKIVDDLKTDCSITGDIPLVAGELLHSGQCAGHNTVVAKIPTTIPNSYVASAKDLGGVDQYHFNAAGYRTMGQRMAVEIMKGLPKFFLPDAVQPESQQRVVSPASVTSQRDNARVYSLDGRFVSTGAAISGAASRTSMMPGNLYIVANKSTGTAVKLMVAPTR